MSGRFVHLAVERDDAAEDRDRVAESRLAERVERRRREGGAAGIGVLDRDAPALVELERQLERSIRVENGRVFAIPILGPLSDIINKIIPKAGYQTARLATADFRMGDEKISTDNLVVEGSGFSLFGNGDIYFMKDRMDMSVRINARGIPGIVLFPVSKLFEYVSTGSVSNPEWKPKIIPRFGNGDQKATP